MGAPKEVPQGNPEFEERLTGGVLWPSSMAGPIIVLFSSMLYSKVPSKVFFYIFKFLLKGFLQTIDLFPW